MIHQDSAWSFTRRELWHLLGGFAPALLIGIPNPYFGRAADLVHTEQTKAAESLRQKGLYPFRPGDPSPLGAALAACAHPVLSLMITSQFAGSAGTRRTIHFHDKKIFVHRDIDPERQDLVQIPGREALLDSLAHDLRMDSNLPAAQDSFCVSEADFFEANRACRAGDAAEARRILSAGGADADCAATVVAALENPLANAAAVSVRVSGHEPVVGGWGVLEGGGRIWMLRPARGDGRRLTEGIPAGPGIIQNELERMLP